MKYDILIWIFLTLITATGHAGIHPAPKKSASTAMPVKWRPAAVLLPAREGNSVSMLPDGRVLVAGGIKGKKYLKSAFIWNPVNNRWKTVASLSSPRANHSATVLNDGRVLVAGGTTGADDMSSPQPEIWNPVTNTWTHTGRMNEERIHYGAVLLADGRVLVVGGAPAGNSWTSEVLLSAEIWNPYTGAWTTVASMKTKRIYPSVTRLENGHVLVLGGIIHSGIPEVYDPAANRWSSTGKMVTVQKASRSGMEDARPIDNFTATLLLDGRVLVVGGRWMMSQALLETSQIYDPNTNFWQATGNLAMGRIAHVAALLPDGRVLIAGGQRWGFANAAAERRAAKEACEGYWAPDIPIREAELWDPATGQWQSAGRLKWGRWSATAVTLPDGRVMVVGGMTKGDRPVGQTELWGIKKK
ncbi:MAG: hypothetical protein JXR76_08520 [Deltaproteobacteria bacterium]|nr:hypothetical protein [Deltaproteobacteria bacterium]